MSRIQDTRFLPMRRLAVAVALGAMIAPFSAIAEDEVDRLTNPDTTQFSFGLAHSDHDNQRFGMYNGLEEGQGYAIGSVNLIRRDDEGLWARINGRNLGLSTAEIAAEVERQGQWRIAVDYNQTPRVTPYTIHTNLQGIGSNDLSHTNNGVSNGTQVVMPASTARGIDLETNRYKSRLELSRTFIPEIELKVLFQHENKQGQRLFGRGTPSQQEFLAEPIDFQTRQVDVTLNYTGERLQLSAGYYGSFFENEDPALNITGGAFSLRSGATPFTPIALPPDNSAHQFSLMGAYQFTDTTRASLKLAHTRAIQDDDFIDVGFIQPANTVSNNISGRTDLGGHVDTTLIDLGLTSRPISKLSLIAKMRYEDREDKTTTARYVIPTGTTSTTDGFNEQRSLTIESGMLQATYQLPQGFSLTGAVDAERKERTMEGVRVVGYRERVEEMTYRLGLRRSIAETLTGSLGFERSDRTGSDFRTLRTWNTTLNAGAGGFNLTEPGGLYVLGGLLQPIYIADRDRSKIKMALDWLPTDALSVQFNAEKSRDDYEAGRQAPDIGAREGNAWLLNIDATYMINDDWKLSAWATRHMTRMDQAACTNQSTNPAPASVANGIANCLASTWTSDLISRSDAVGMGVRGKMLSKINLGADMVYMRDHNTYRLGGTATTDLPDITSYMTSLKLFGNYSITKESSLQLDYMLDRRTTNDWTWTDWRYTDGTTIDQDPSETTHFLGVSYRYGFR